VAGNGIYAGEGEKYAVKKTPPAIGKRDSIRGGGSPVLIKTEEGKPALPAYGEKSISL